MMRLNGSRQAVAILLLLGGALSATASEDALDRLLELRHRRKGFSGTVLALRGGDVVFEHSYGLSDFESGAPFSPDTLFRIGSITKPFTAAAVLLLEKRGALSVGDPLCRYLSPCPAEWSAVEVRHLLTHTSGIPDLFEAVAEAPVEETVAKIHEAIAASADLALSASPGERYSYSNFGYLLLGAVIEAASGRFYEDTLRESVWVPLGLAHTRYDRVWKIVEGRARGYTLDGGELLNTEYDDPCAYAAGGLLSTPRDLARFARAVASGELLGAETTRRALTPYRDGYGFGWVIAEHYGRPVIWHNGGIGGFSSQLLHYPDDDLTVVVLSNVENANADGVACAAAAHFLGATPDLPVEPEAVGEETPELSLEQLARYAGSYLTESGAREVVLEGGTLLYRGSVPLVPIGPDAFRFERPDHYRLLFEREADGSTAAFVVEACGAVILRGRRVEEREAGHPDP